MPSTKQQGSTHLFGMRRENLYTLATFTAWKVSKYGLEITPYLDTFHATLCWINKNENL